MTHHISIDPKEFVLLASGKKNFLVRFDNSTYTIEGKPFEVGDELLFEEYDVRKKTADRYSGRKCLRVVDYIERDSTGLLNGYAVLGLAPEPGSSPNLSDNGSSQVKRTDCSWK